VITVLAILIPPFPCILVYLVCWMVMPSEENMPMNVVRNMPPPDAARTQDNP